MHCHRWMRLSVAALFFTFGGVSPLQLAAGASIAHDGVRTALEATARTHAPIAIDRPRHEALLCCSAACSPTSQVRSATTGFRSDISAGMAHPLAGKPAPREMLVDVTRLLAAYEDKPDPKDPAQRVSFGTSGHRGSSLKRAFNDAHIAAVTQAVCEFRKQQGTSGPLYLGIDTHALSGPARVTCLEVLVTNGVDVRCAKEGEWTPTPVVSHAILTYNRGRKDGLSDGIVITPSHNPPEDGGIKYNPPSGGPADTTATKWIENHANQLLAAGLKAIARVPYARALKTGTTHRF